MASTKEISVLIEEDTQQEAGALSISVDEESYFYIFQEDGEYIRMSLAQANAVHQQLGQVIVRHDRSWGGVGEKAKLRPVA